MDYLHAIKKQLINGNAAALKKNVEGALAAGHSAWNILNEGLMPGMEELGHMLKNGDVFFDEVMISVGAMRGALEIIRPLLLSSVSGAHQAVAGTILIGTVAGDIHTLGKDLVCMMLEGAGYNIIDLGKDVTAIQFAAAVEKYKPDLVAMSGLLTSSKLSMKNIIAHLRNSGFKGQIILVGGGAVSAADAGAIGADSYGEDASTVISIVNSLIRKLRAKKDD